MKEKMIRPKKEVINLGVIDRDWEYSPEPRLEGLLQASKYLKWKNIQGFNEIKKEEKNDGRTNKITRT